jgi:hypothetical protein
MILEINLVKEPLGMSSYESRPELIKSVVTKGVEIATKRAIALKKLITHNPRDGVR